MTSLFTGCHQPLGLCIILLASVLFSSPLLAVNCTSANIGLSTQTEVDDFQATYGGGGTCDTVTGDLTIIGADISDLAGLSALTSVGGLLLIRSNTVLANVNGLSALTSVGGFLAITLNTVLVNVNGLSALTSVGGDLTIGSNPALANVNGLSTLTSVVGVNISQNTVLANLDGLSALTSVGGDLKIQSNPVVNVNGLSGVTSVSGNLTIGFSHVLPNLDGLLALTSVGGDLSIGSNNTLVNVNGLSALTSVGGEIAFVLNSTLANLDGLSALTSVGGRLRIQNNPALANVNGLSALISVGDDVRINTNPQLALCSGLTALLDDVDDGAPGPGPGAAGIPDVGGDVIMNRNLPGCNSVAQVLGGPATFDVFLEFDDNNDWDGATAYISCTGGLPLGNESADPLENDGHVTFIVEHPSEGEGATNCDVWADSLDGYTIEYNPTGTAESNDDADGCHFISVVDGDANRCDVLLIPDDSYLRVTKTWDTINAGGDRTNYHGQIAVCVGTDGVLAGGRPVTFTSDWCVMGEVWGPDDDYLDVTFTGANHGGNDVYIYERILDSSVEIDITDCVDRPMPKGNNSLVGGFSYIVKNGDGNALGGSRLNNCTITNTIFFEGIPTLNQYGLAILVLLMMGVGLVGFRRFV